MPTVLLLIVIALAAALLLLAAVQALRDRLINDAVLIVSAALVLALLVQAVVGITRAGSVDDGAERATLIAYLLTVPIVPVAAAYLAIKEKTRWAMVVLAVGAGGVLVMSYRAHQILTAAGHA